MSTIVSQIEATERAVSTCEERLDRIDKTIRLKDLTEDEIKGLIAEEKVVKKRLKECAPNSSYVSRGFMMHFKRLAVDEMEVIFHEKQEGSLCAQHCLNALLQGPYFSAVDLADIARGLDEEERRQMAEGGTNTEGYQQFMKQPSNNFDDSGFFSVQVIDKALRVWSLELLQYNSQNELARQARQSPTSMSSFICNFGEHWLTVRKLGNQWFNLNSLLTGPELISDTYLGMFLTQLQQEGYSIFIVVGDLAETEADQLLRLCPATQPIKPKLISETGQSKGKQEGAPSGEGDEEDVNKALQESKKLVEDDDISLQRALQMSMEGYIEESVNRIDTACVSDGPSTSAHGTSSSRLTGETTSKSGEATVPIPSGSGYTLSGTSNVAPATDNSKPSVDEMRLKRLAYLDKLSNTSNNAAAESAVVNTGTTDNPSKEPVINSNEGASASGELTEEEMLQQAIAMSMSQDT